MWFFSIEKSKIDMLKKAGIDFTSLVHTNKVTEAFQSFSWSAKYFCK